jgi:tRNA-2-methylthio-N6-dimethylallyladenosine synthase
MLGQTVEVLVERQNFKDSALMKGRTRCWKNVLFPGDDGLIGSFQKVTIHSYSHQTLLGAILAA